MLSLEEIAKETNMLDVAAFTAHRQAVGHRTREVCDQCPQPITRMIVKYAEDNYGIKRRRRERRGILN